MRFPALFLLSLQENAAVVDESQPRQGCGENERLRCLLVLNNTIHSLNDA